MYNPYDPYAQYQSYNDPQPEHYAAGVPAGMPQPARPSAFSSAEPAYPSHYGNSTSLYETPYGSQPYGSQPYGSQQPSYYPANPASTEDQYTASYDSLAHSASNRYPPLAPQPSPSLSHAGSHHYPPPFGQSTAHQYPPAAPPDPYSSGGYSTSHSDVSAENPWAPSYLPRKEHLQQEERLQTHAIPKRDDKKENVSFSVEEAQAIIKQLKETIKSLNLQLTNSRESSNKVVQEKDAKLAQLQNEIENVRGLQAQAVDPREAVAAVEREWTQRVASKEHEILARTQRDADAMAETLLKSQQENALLLARVSKLQSDADSGRAFLLETNAALEAELVTRRDAAGQQDAEVLRLKDETEKQEAELMKLREETNKLFDEITQMVDEKEHSSLSLEQLEGEKRELEAQLTQLKDHSEGYMAEKEAGGAEKSSLLGRIAALEQELEECRDLCEDRRQRIESLENEELPTLNSQLDLMATLDEKARQQIAELEEKLEDGRQAVDGLEKQLNEAQKQEMENSLRVAGESRSALEELQRLRFELDHHVQGKSENEKSVLELESQRRTFEQRAAQVEEEKKEAVEHISALEKSLKDVTAAKEELEEEMGIIRDTLDRETEENEEAQNEFRLQIEKLEEQIEKLKEQVSTLTTAKSTLETRVAESEDKVLETKRILQATEDMLKVLEEDLQQKREEATAAGVVAPSSEKAELEETMAKLEEKNAQIAKLTERAQAVEEETRELCNKMDGMEKYIVELENMLAEKDDALAEKDDALADTQAELLAKKRLEREVKGLRLELGKENMEVKRLKAEVVELGNLSRDANGKIFDLEMERAQLEEKTAALLEDKKRDSIKASQMGEDILKLETENKELDSRVSDITSKFCDIVAERDQLVQTNRNLLRNK